MSWPGFQLNTKALCAAAHVFSNRREDLVNLKRLLPAERLTYVRPGIQPEAFGFDPAARSALRKEWGVDATPVVLTAAMFRPGVKTAGLETVIRTCGRLRQNGRPLFLAVAGDGRERDRLKDLARRHLADNVVFTGQIPRKSLYRFYSAGDLFAFPGIRESLGMVYLEAQACGLPVVAYDNGGVPEVVRNGETGSLVPLMDEDAFGAAMGTLLADASLRRQIGHAARRHVAQRHCLATNYAAMAQILERVAASGVPKTARAHP
jgi:glycosyltransferase involved in cell wall biosynthesis